MACSYVNSMPSTFAAAGYTSPINVESMLRNKVDIYSTLPGAEAALFNKAPFTGSFVNAATFAPSTLSTPFVGSFNGQLNTVSPVERCVETGRVYGAECGAKLAQVIVARLNAFVGQEIAVRIGAQWGAELCAKLAAELALRPISNTFERDECTRRCAVYGAECGAQLGAAIAKTLNGYPMVELAARIGSEIFSEVCAKLCCDVSGRISESRFGGRNTFGGSFERFGGIFPQTWTGLNNLSSGIYGYPTIFGASNNWTNTWGRPELFANQLNNNTWMNSPVHHDKLYNVAFRPSSEVELYTLTHPVRVLDVEGNRQLYLCFELKSFKPEEVTVTLNKAERAVQIEAVHDVKEGKEHAISRKYSRKFVLPESLSKIDLTKVELKSFVNAEGYLIVEAQLPKMTAEEIAKCPTMSQVYNKMPFAGYNAFNTANGINSISCNVNNVKPVTVKTA